MFRSVKIFGFLINLTVILIASDFYTTQFEECDKLLIEGGRQAVRKILTDLKEIKEMINDLKSSIQECPKESKTSPEDLEFFDIRYDVLPKKCVTKILPKNCAEATACTRRSGIYKILVTQHSKELFYVECDAKTEGGGWIVIQSRKDGSVDFFRNWKDYEEGFGDVESEHYIGLKTCTRRSSIYKILVKQHCNETFYVECDAETEDGGWTVIQRREDGTVDFFCNWMNYEKGFGDVDGDHFIGLEKLYTLTNFQGRQQLLIVMEDAKNKIKRAKYNGFSIGDETKLYKLGKLGNFSNLNGYQKVLIRIRIQATSRTLNM